MTVVYRVFGYFGLFSIFAAILNGFRYDPAAPWANHLFNLMLYTAFIAPHLVMTSDGFKRAVYGKAGTLIERQVYIAVTVATWLALLWFHRSAPGGALAVAEPLRFAAMVGFLVALIAFFEGATFTMLDGLLGVPGGAMTHSHGEETPLFTEGQYAKVRHPQYRAVILAGLCSVVMHPNLAQLLWCLLLGGTFIAFIPMEEGRLSAARGEAYAAYMQRTPWRLLRGVW
ncbi:MAG: hypothetical protein HY699_03270 [Deltaproteobacteria bacterium]|nr:hypothetical protein [Deltaproteobacteria bacterium]